IEMNATIKTVAKLAGVSPAAVSKALNGRTDIGEETRNRILEICEQVGYTPNQAARSLVTRASTMLGLLIPDISTPIYPEIFKGLDAEAKRRGFNLFLCDTNRKADFEKSYVRILMEHRACGIIVAPVGNDVSHILSLVRGSIPIIFIGGKVNDEMDNYVATDNRLGSQLAVDHLASLGHRDIAMICDNYGTKTKQDRIAGYEAAMVERGLPSRIIAAGAGHPEGMEYGYSSMLTLADSGQMPSAIYTSSDMVALGVMKAAAERKIHIPADVSLVGYDDIMFASLPVIMLTTIAQPRYEIGVQAVELLCRAMQDGESGAKKHRATVLPRLVVRTTTASYADPTKEYA
ncbi:MAG TPA: LacI family DNA-binding transcriptional regulator, partial [Rectinemataceae bacterium]|nr:LacI family DNA-binding transcriptional regulator [Rectinemataceae bacterium]